MKAFYFGETRSQAELFRLRRTVLVPGEVMVPHRFSGQCRIVTLSHTLDCVRSDAEDRRRILANMLKSPSASSETKLPRSGASGQPLFR
jgi:hypothetical protein